MAILISKRIPHTHNGADNRSGICYGGAWYDAVCPTFAWAHGHYGVLNVGGKCAVCGATLVKGGPHYACTCKASSCGTVSVDYSAGVLTASVSTEDNDTGVSNVAYEWKYNGNVVSNSSSYTPLIDGKYSLTVTCTDNKVNKPKSVELEFNVDCVAEWDDVFVGDVKIYGMAVGDILVDHIAVGDIII